MAFVGRDGRDSFNPLNNPRRNPNPQVPAEPERPPTFGPNPFGRANRANRANRARGTNPPFTFAPEPRQSSWRFRGDGRWELNMNDQPRPIRGVAYNADLEYARFQARALGLPPPAERGPAAVPPSAGGAPPPPPPPPPPPAPGAGAPPVEDEAAGPPVVPLGRTGNAGTGRELNVPPAIRLYHLGRDLLGHVRAVINAVAGFICAIWHAINDVAGPLLHFAMQWAIFLICVAFAAWATIPAVLRTLVAAHRYVAMFFTSILEVLDWAFGLDIQWPRGSLVSYTLRPEYTSRAVTGMAYALQPGVCPVGDSIRGPPYGASALSSTDFTLPYPFSLPPIRIVWAILWTLLVAPVCALVCTLAAALAIDLQVWPSEDDDRDQ